MYRFWDVLIEPALEAVGAKVIVEIGSDTGANTKNLLAFCERNDGRLHVVDPLPKYDVAEWQARYGERLVFHRDLSLNVLGEIEGSDAVLIDGDHNWYTVFNELRLIEERSRTLSRPFPLVMLHDVGWPYGRRDLYYDPETIPPEYRQPHERRGMKVGFSGLPESGGMNTHLYNATHEGGPRNGVLTAVEDFIEASEEPFELLIVPALHGFAVLAPASLVEGNEALAELLRSFTAEGSALSRVVELVEGDRLGVEILRQETAALHARETSRLEGEVREMRDRQEKLTAQLDREKENVRRLVRWTEEINHSFGALLASRQWRTGRAVGEVYRRLRRQPRTPLAAERITAILREFKAWQRQSRRRGGGGGNPAKPAAGARAGKGPAPTKPSGPSGSSSGLGAVARRVGGRVRRLKPRMPRAVLAKRVRERLGPPLGLPAGLERWPAVSILVLNRDGLKHLKTLFAGLRDRTDYPSFEVVLVDNASTDGSVEFAESFAGGFGVRTVRNPGNVSFSVGNNQAAEVASGDLFLLLNNDVEPLEPGWLKELVAALEASGADASGARLLYPTARSSAVAGFSVQHRGIKFHSRTDFPQYYNLGSGENPLDERLGRDEACPAATAACLLVRPEAYRAVGGLTVGYRYGTEDVDFGLKLTAGGRKVISSGRTVLLHHEFGTQGVEGRAFVRLNRKNNRLLFGERWGPKLHREFLLEKLGKPGFWGEEPPHIAITVTSRDVSKGYGDWYTAHELGDALQKRGWNVTYLGEEEGEWYEPSERVDFLLVLLDSYNVSRISGVTTIAWVRNWTERWIERPWFHRFDVVLASSGISKEIIERRTAKAATLFPIATNPQRFRRTEPDQTYEADYVFTGNHWGPPRYLINNLDVRPEEKFLIFGKGWNAFPRLFRYAHGPLPYDRLPQLYSSAKLLLDDAAVSTLPYGSVNSRVFDALATGTLVVSNCESGVRELFDDDFPTYSDRASLRASLDLLLNDPERREELASRYREVVLREHTYEKRAQRLEDLLRERAEATSFCIKIGPPTGSGPSRGVIRTSRGRCSGSWRSADIRASFRPSTSGTTSRASGTTWRYT